jgi:hypothetical protein
MQNDEWIVSNIPGAKQLFDLFGYWPSFHDAEILQVHLDRTNESWLKIHTWETTKELDHEGHFVLDKHVVVTLTLRDLEDLDLIGFNHQNVIFGLSISPGETGIEISLEACYGLAGTMIAKNVSLEVLPVEPD